MENEIPEVLAYESEGTDRVVGDIPRMRKGSLWSYSHHKKKVGMREAEEIKMNLKSSDVYISSVHSQREPE